jgi:hypothetical protein
LTLCTLPNAPIMSLWPYLSHLRPRFLDKH